VKRALVLSLLLVACGHTDVHELLLRDPAPREPPREPVVFMEGHRPSRPFYEMALLQVAGFGNEADARSVLGALTARAKELGCDAVVRVSTVLGQTRGHAFGVCVRFVDPPQAAPSPTVPPPPPASPPPSPPSEPTEDDAVPL
jgi:hypothetical protein